jgi:peptide/nickel transport system substrate-binding protein
MALFPSGKIVYLGLNIRPTLKDGTKNPLADKRLRQALNYAVEKKAIAQIVTYGMGTPQLTLPPAATPYAMTDKGEPYPYNLDKAKALMKEAGLESGVDITIYAVAGNADQAAEVAAIQQMWAAIGVRLKVQLFDSATAVAKYRADDFQMRAAAWTNDINDPSQIVSYMAYFPAYESNRSGFNDAELNSLFEKSQTETDAAKRAALFRRIQEIYVDAAPMVFLLDSPYAVALDKKTQGFVQLPLGNYMFLGIHMEP